MTENNFLGVAIFSFFVKFFLHQNWLTIYTEPILPVLYFILGECYFDKYTDDKSIFFLLSLFFSPRSTRITVLLINWYDELLSALHLSYSSYDVYLTISNVSSLFYFNNITDAEHFARRYKCQQLNTWTTFFLCTRHMNKLNNSCVMSRFSTSSYH